MNLILYAILALAIMGTIGVGVAKVKAWGGNEVRAEWTAANEKARAAEAAKSAAAAKELEAERAKKKVVYRTITQSVEKYVDRPVYRADCWDADGMRDATAAINGKIATGREPSPAMPAARPTR